MNYFTPELYSRFNSADDDQAIQADADWEDAIIRYKKDLAMYRDDLPPGAKLLAENVDLHDAEILEINLTYLVTRLQFLTAPVGKHPSVWLPPAINSQFSPELLIALKVEDEVRIILYSLWDRVEPKKLKPNPMNERIYWLYDEIIPDQKFPRHFWHNILLSNESTIEIPFFDCAFIPIGTQGVMTSKD